MIKNIYRPRKNAQSYIDTEISGKSQQDYHVIFIIGAEGSGTTMLKRILSHPKAVIGLKTNPAQIRKENETAHLLVQQIDKTIKQLWDRQASSQAYQQAKVDLPRFFDKLFGLDIYSQTSHIVFKKSTPFGLKGKHRPDLSDLVDLFPKLRIVVIYRDPKAATYSALRRGFTDDIKQAARSCEEHLTYLSSQLQTLEPSMYHIINYEKFCAQPRQLLDRLAEFCQLSADELWQAVEQEKVSTEKNKRWQQELGPTDIAFLNQFFDARRLSQWPLLSKGA